MHLDPLRLEERERMIVWLAEGLGPRAAQLMRDTLSDGHLRTIYDHEQARLREAAQEDHHAE